MREDHTEGGREAAQVPPVDPEPYEPPTITDYGSLTELTLSGTAPLSDSFGGAAGGS